MNLLLTLKDAAEKLGIDWYDQASIDDVSRKIQDLVQNNAAYAKVQLHAVKYMTAYLEWSGAPGDYSRLRGQVERFRDVGKNLAWVAKEDGSRETEMLELCFNAIAVGMSHPDMREIRRMLKTEPAAFDKLTETVEAIAEEASDQSVEDEAPLAPPPPADEEDEEDEDEDEDEREDESRPAVIGLSPKRQQIKRAIDVAVRTSRDARESDGPTDVELAATRLAKVEPAALIADASGGELKRLREAIEAIIAWSAAAQEAFAEADDGES